MKNKLLEFFGISAASSLLANAAVVSIDFNAGATSPSQGGLAAAPDAAGAAAIWNTTTGGSPSVTGALDSTGATTPVNLTINSRGSFLGPADQELASGHSDLFSDYLTSRANDSGADLRTGSFSGLIAGNSYDIYFYGQGDNFTDTNNNGGQNVGIRIGTEVRHTSYDGTSGGDGALVEDVEYVLFKVTADAAGTISFEHFNPGTGVHGTDSAFFDTSTGLADVDGNPSRFHALNGIQIVGTFVPEPTSGLLLGLSSLLVVLRRRR